MRLSDAGLRSRTTKTIYLDHRPLLGSPKMQSRDRSNRLLGVNLAACLAETPRVGALRLDVTGVKSATLLTSVFIDLAIDWHSGKCAEGRTLRHAASKPNQLAARMDSAVAR